MITCDRIMLARHSINEMNAVVVIGTLLFTFEWTISSIAVTSEIFAGQYNGQGRKEKTPIATWQMLGLSLFSVFFFIPAGLFMGPILIPSEFYFYGKDFFQIIMFFLALAPANSSINGFFVGIKKGNIILRNAIISNLTNIILSYFFIFGVEGYIPAHGAKGAAIATTIALSLQFCLGLYSFTSKKIHDEYKTRLPKFDKEILLKCLNLGIPSSIGIIAEMLGSYFMQILIVLYASQYVTNHTITLNIYVFLTFLLNGMHKATCGLGANIIGENKIHLLDKLVTSSFKIHFIFSIPVLIACIFFGENIARIYTDDLDIIRNTIYTLPWMAVVFFLEGIGWITAGIIIAGGDTKFNMYVNIVGIWVFRVVPLYLLLKSGISFVAIGWVIATFGNILYVMMYYQRYQSKKWLKLRVS
jgi:MATE family multidrug resistance protein